MRLLSEADVARLIDPELAIACAEAAFALQAGGTAPSPGRLDLRRDNPRAGMLVLAGFGEGDAFVVKTNAHGYGGTGGHRMARSLLVLWDMAQVRPLAGIASAGFNDHRTAAGFAAAARLLAPPRAETLTIFGAGKLAGPTLRYLATVRPIRRAFLIGRSPGRADALAARAAAWPELAGIDLLATQDVEHATREADILAAVTSADAPVFPGALVKPGALVVLGGANRPGAREADDALIRRAVIHADHAEGASEKAGDLHIPLSEGTIRREAIGEIGALLGQSVPALRPGQVHVFKSIGIAPQDLILARALMDRAEARGIGTIFDTDGAMSLDSAA